MGSDTGGVGRWLERVAGDARMAVRGLRRDAWFSLGIVATVSSALAANAALVAFLDGYFWKPLPIARAQDHVEVAGRDVRGRVNGAWASVEAQRLVVGARSVLDHAYSVAERRASVVLEGAPEPRTAVGAVASRDYFTLLHPRPAIRTAALPGRVPRTARCRRRAERRWVAPPDKQARRRPRPTDSHRRLGLRRHRRHVAGGRRPRADHPRLLGARRRLRGDGRPAGPRLHRRWPAARGSQRDRRFGSSGRRRARPASAGHLQRAAIRRGRASADHAHPRTHRTGTAGSHAPRRVCADDAGCLREPLRHLPRARRRPGPRVRDPVRPWSVSHARGSPALRREPHPRPRRRRSCLRCCLALRRTPARARLLNGDRRWPHAGTGIGGLGGLRLHHAAVGGRGSGCTPSARRWQLCPPSRLHAARVTWFAGAAAHNARCAAWS